MDSLCFKAGIHGLSSPPIAAAVNGEIRLNEKPSVSAAQPRNLSWGFTFRHPLRSLWPVGKTRHEQAIAVDDAVMVEEKEEINDTEERERDGSWVFKILHVKSQWKEEEKTDEMEEEVGVKSESGEEIGDEESHKSDEDCDFCAIDYVDDEEKIEFDRESFSKLLRKVSLAEAKLYAKICYLGNLAYMIPQIKSGNLLKNRGLRFITSSIEKKEQASKVSAEDQQGEVKAPIDACNVEENETEQTDKGEAKTEGNGTGPSAAYQIAASAASYLQSHTKSILRFRRTKSMPNENTAEEINGDKGDVCIVNEDVASLMATTDSVTAVVAAKEEVKQAVADDLNSTRSSPCEWFVCDDDQSATRFFVVQGSESLASWQANLLFEPIQFEGLDFLVHRGIYEAAKGMYEQMLPDIHEHLKSHVHQAMLRFTGHSLGGSLSLLISLMLLIRGDAPRSSLLPVITFGAPSVMCGGDRLLRKLGLPRNYVQSITMHRDIVPRAFSCNYPNHVAEFLKAVNGNFRNHPCLNKQKLLYAPMGEFLILQPDDKFSPNHDLLPSGSGLYILTCPESDIVETERQIRAAQTVFLNSPHPLEILSDRSAYGSEGTIQRDHDMNSYLKSVKNIIRQDLNRMRKAKRDQRRKLWWPLVGPRGVNAGIVMGRPMIGSGNTREQNQFNFSGMIQTGRESLKRFSTLVASQNMHLLVVFLFPARLLVLGTYSSFNFH